MVARILLFKAGRFLIGFLLTLGAGIIGWWHGKRLHQQGITLDSYSQRNPLTWLGVLRILLTVAVIVALWHLADTEYQVLLQVGRFFPQFQVVIPKMLMTFLICICWHITPDRTRLLRALPFLVIAFLVTTGIELYMLTPAFFFTKHDVALDGSIRQSTDQTCGPAALANVFRAYGIDLRETDAARAMEIGLTGSMDDEMVAGAQELGFSGAMATSTTLEALADLDLPALLNVDYEGMRERHVVALVGLSSETVLIIDPHVGLTYRKRTRFLQDWHGRAILLGQPTQRPDATLTLSGFSWPAFKATSQALDALERPPDPVPHPPH